MFALFIAFILLVLLAFDIQFLFKKQLGLSFGLSALLIIFVLYFFGLFKILAVGSWLLLIAIVGLTVWSLIKIIKKKEWGAFKIFYSPLFICFIVFFIICVICLFSRRLYNWDEFSHWGLIVKNMNSWNNFGNGIETSTICKGYPPAISLFLYFFQFFGSGFCDGVLFIAMNLLMVCFLVMPIKQTKNNLKNILILISSFLIILLVPIFFYKTIYFDLRIDACLGIIFAIILFIYFNDRKINRENLLIISILSFILCISKASGFGICLIAFVIILFDFLFFNKLNLKEFLKNKKNYWFLFIPIISIILAKYSWEGYCAFYKLNEAWGVEGANSILSIFKNGFSTTQKQIIKNFINGFTNYSVNLIFFIIVILFIACFLKTDKSKVLYLLFALPLGYLLYSGSLLYLYLFSSFTEAEALGLACFDRYMCTYVIGAFLLVISLFLKNEKFINTLKNSFAILLILCVAFCSMFSIHYINIKKSNAGTKGIHQYLSNLDAYVKTLDKNEDKVYCITNWDPGIYFVILNYTITPIDSNYRFDANILANSRDGVNARILTENELLGEIQDYNYLYFIWDNKNFANDYENLFEDVSKMANDTLFKIDRTGSKVVFKYVPWEK